MQYFCYCTDIVQWAMFMYFMEYVSLNKDIHSPLQVKRRMDY